MAKISNFFERREKCVFRQNVTIWNEENSWVYGIEKDYFFLQAFALLISLVINCARNLSDTSQALSFWQFSAFYLLV